MQEKQKQILGCIDYIDLYYCEDNEQIIIRTETNRDKTFISLHIDLYNFIKCVNKSDLNRFKKQLIKNINNL